MEQNKSHTSLSQPKAIHKMNSLVPVVGIGTSAGGLAALQEFFAGFYGNAKTGFAFVIIQHLSPDHISILVSLIQKSTDMPVIEISEGQELKADCVYIIPPRYGISYVNGFLKLYSLSDKSGPRTSIDEFFKSAASALKNKFVAVILTGNGADGSNGIKAVHLEKGLVLVQDRSSSEFDGMPNAAMETGAADLELSPLQMSKAIFAYKKSVFEDHQWNKEIYLENDFADLSVIFETIRKSTGHDFSFYKVSTVVRRLSRRMAIRKISNLDEYVRLMKADKDEAKALFADLLIGVTHFFRDPSSFQFLQEQVLPKILKSKATNSTLRIWTAGCSTGEEAYSLAILVLELLEKSKQKLKVQIFATDIDKTSIAKARMGLYSKSDLSGVSAERLAKFFYQESDSNYRVRHFIRQTLIFSEHDLIRDPPFFKVDLITCRNLLIYFKPELQKYLIPIFHYALNPNGFLMLGNSEGIGDHLDLFASKDPNSKIFARISHSLQNRKLNIKQFFQTNAQGNHNLNFPTPEAHIAKSKSISKIKSRPKTKASKASNLEVKASAKKASKRATNKKDELSKIKEELRAFKSEMRSIQEELQSANEELETSKEELQSVNEELSTVNSELQSKVQELSRANNDMNNLLNGTGIGSLFLDLDLHVLRFTPAVTGIVNLIASDLGRPIQDLAFNFESYQNFTEDLKSVLKNLKTKELKVKSILGKTYNMKIMPYRTLENIVEGVVVTFFEV